MGISSELTIETIKQQLANHGYKYTDQREAVFNIILANKEKHISTEEIYDSLKNNHMEMGMATVYRTLMMLEKIKIVRKTDFDDGRIRYELCYRDKHAHHHLICRQCGAIFDLEEDLLGELEEEIFSKKHFWVTNHTVKFYGYCRDCAE